MGFPEFFLGEVWVGPERLVDFWYVSIDRGGGWLVNWRRWWDFSDDVRWWDLSGDMAQVGHKGAKEKEKSGEMFFHKRGGDPIPEYLWFKADIASSCRCIPDESKNSS